jgi:hypothetical protein
VLIVAIAIRLVLLEFLLQTRRDVVAVSGTIAPALVPALLARLALWSLSRTARLPSTAGMASRTYAPPLRIGSAVVGDEANWLRLRRRRLALVAMDNVLLVLRTAIHGWVVLTTPGHSLAGWCCAPLHTTTTKAVSIV